MDLRQIRYFMGVADARNFLRAAAKLRVSQPALSKAIKNLETVLQVKLFDRNASGVTLTVYGKTLYKYGIAITSEISSARQELHAIKNTPSGLIIIGALRAVTTSILPTITIDFLKRHKDVRIRIVEYHSPDLMAGLERGEFDFIIGIVEANLVERGFGYEFLFNDHLSILGRKGHPIWKNRKITPNIMKRYSWVLPRVGLLHRRRLDEMFMAAGLEPLHSSIESGELQYIRSVVLQSDYLALIPEHSLILEKQLDIFSVYPLNSELMMRPIGLIFDANRTLSEGAKALAKELCTLCASSAKKTKGFFSN